MPSQKPTIKCVDGFVQVLHAIEVAVLERVREHISSVDIAAVMDQTNISQEAYQKLYHVLTLVMRELGFAPDETPMSAPEDVKSILRALNEHFDQCVAVHETADPGWRGDPVEACIASAKLHNIKGSMQTSREFGDTMVIGLAVDKCPFASNRGLLVGALENLTGVTRSTLDVRIPVKIKSADDQVLLFAIDTGSDDSHVLDRNLNPWLSDAITSHNEGLDQRKEVRTLKQQLAVAHDLLKRPVSTIYAYMNIS